MLYCFSLSNLEIDEAKMFHLNKQMEFLMYNLRYKLLLIACTLITGVQTTFGAGGTNASQYYTDHTRQFLGYLGQKNPSAVPIKKMSKNDPNYHVAAGYSDGSSIYLNEDFFAKPGRSKGTNLFTCAHEAAHHALHHAYQGHRNGLEIEKEADVEAARMLCKNGFRWVVEQEVAMLKNLVQAGQGHYTDGKHPTTQQQYVYLGKVLGTKYAPNKLDEPSKPKGKNGKPDKSYYKPNKPNDKAHKPYRDPYKQSTESIKDLWGQFNDLSRNQKMVIAGVLILNFMGWVR